MRELLGSPWQTLSIPFAFTNWLLAPQSFELKQKQNFCFKPSFGSRQVEFSTCKMAGFGQAPLSPSKGVAAHHIAHFLPTNDFNERPPGSPIPGVRQTRTTVRV